MKYELKIEHAADKNGSIDLQRLSLIAESLRKIAEGALQIRLKGVSKAKKTIKLNEALKISLTAIMEGSTILCLESEKFEKTLPGFQTDIFRSEYQQELPNKPRFHYLSNPFTKDAHFDHLRGVFIDLVSVEKK